MPVCDIAVVCQSAPHVIRQHPEPHSPNPSQSAIQDQIERVIESETAMQDYSRAEHRNREQGHSLKLHGNQKPISQRISQSSL